MPSDAFVQLRVTAEVKAVLRTLAQREQISESAVVRQLLETMLRAQLQGSSPKLTEVERFSRDTRVCVRLDEEDRVLLMSRAMQRGMRSATYLALLARSHLRGIAPLPREELLALKGSIAQLAAIGRLLNQMARALNRGGTAPAPGRREVEAMLTIAEGLRNHFKALLTVNARSWETGHAESSH